jgi:hypothetical protein
MEDVSIDGAARGAALAERLFQATLNTWDIATVYLGYRLGLYRALSDVEPATSKELATATGLTERYVREWLEQHPIFRLDNDTSAFSERNGRNPR